MHRLRDLLLDLPLATFVGCVLGLLFVVVALVVDAWPGRPFAALALAPMVAAGGVWVDWARRWRPSERVRRFSALALFAAGWLAFVGALGARGVVDIGWVPSTFLACAFVALALDAATPLALAAGRWWGWMTVEGRVRRDDAHRLVLDTPGGAIDLAREARELGPDRALDLAPGRSVAVLARLAAPSRGPSPYRAEERRSARALIAAPDLASLRVSIAGRARAWSAYFLLLAALSGALAAALSHPAEPPGPPPTRGLAAEA